jgi:hypothetical protein
MKLNISGRYLDNSMQKISKNNFEPFWSYINLKYSDQNHLKSKYLPEILSFMDRDHARIKCNQILHKKKKRIKNRSWPVF